MHRSLLSLIAVVLPLSAAWVVHAEVGSPDAGRGPALSADPAPKVLFADREPEAGRLRGDYAPFETLLIVYTESWADAILTLLEALPVGRNAIVLADEAEAPRVAVWLEAEGVARGRVDVQVIDLDSPWVRDFAPLQVVDPNGRVTWLDTLYADDRPRDDALPELLAERFGIDVEPVSFPLDGGALISNGEGLCASTREALEESGVQLDALDGASWLVEDLGCTALAIMPALSEEPTQHADVIAQFLDAETVVVGSMDAVSDPVDAARLDAAAEILRSSSAALDQPLTVLRLPIERGEGDVYYSWVNGLRMGGRYAVPHYEGATPELEAAAHDLLREALPDVELLAVAAEPMIHLGGAIHCISAELSFGTGRDVAMNAFVWRAAEQH